MIAINLQNIAVPRPLIHDTWSSTITALASRVSYVLIDRLHDDIFYAKVVIEKEGKEYPIDCRPSDAIALALRAEAPIFVESVVLDQAGVRKEVPETEESERPIQTALYFQRLWNALMGRS